MRELVYLSDRKLEQFLPLLRSFWPRPKVNFKAHGLEIAVEPKSDTKKSELKHLAKVIAHIDETARWFLEPGLEPGQWVHFEAPLNHLMVNREDSDLVFFVDRNTATTDYPSGGTTRLVLHCSGIHLRTRSRPVRIPAPPGEDVGCVVPVDLSEGGSDGDYVFNVNSIELLLIHLRASQPFDQYKHNDLLYTRHHLNKATSELLRVIDARLYPETAAWMAGYARVTADLTAPHDDAAAHYLVATPLYIEYATPPGAD